jgi:hypothetical protein
MTLGRAPEHEDLYRSTRGTCEARLPEGSIFRLLARDSHRLFPEEDFADLFTEVGRRSIPPRIVAVVMVLQRLHGLSDREATEAFAFDLRWKYAAGCLEFDHRGFVHTVLVDMRARLRGSARADRIFEKVLEIAKEAGLVGRKRVLDSTALYDAVATQDTITMIRSSIRSLLRVLPEDLGAELRKALKRQDSYETAGKPACDWDDAAAREALVDALARDAHAVLAVLEGRPLSTDVKQACQLVATVVGQDLEKREDGAFVIAGRVSKDRVISTVDPEARHGHKTAARGFDGYKGHLAIDPDSEIVVATQVTAGNVGDGAAATEMLTQALEHAEALGEKAAIYGDASYGTAEIVERIQEAGAEANVKVQKPSPPRKGLFAQDAFVIDQAAGTATCPNSVVVPLQRFDDGSATEAFGRSCAQCPLRDQCTSSPSGRTLNLHPKHEILQRSRLDQRDPAWKALYRQTRPKVERKIAHLMKRRHGGRRVRVRGRLRVSHDFSLLAAAVNLARLAVLRLSPGRNSAVSYS